MARRCLLLATVLLIVGLSSSALPAETPGEAKPGEAKIGILLDAIRANRRALIAVNLKLNEQEAGLFWPIYDRYQKEMSALSDRVAAVVEDYIKSYRDLSNDKAIQLTQDYLSIQADQIKVRRTYLDEFTKVLPGRTVARFYQIENKMDAVIRYELAATIPVVDEGGAAPAAK